VKNRVCGRANQDLARAEIEWVLIVKILDVLREKVLWRATAGPMEDQHGPRSESKVGTLSRGKDWGKTEELGGCSTT